MGLILIGVGLAVPDLPTAVAVAARLRHRRSTRSSSSRSPSTRMSSSGLVPSAGRRLLRRRQRRPVAAASPRRSAASRCVLRSSPLCRLPAAARRRWPTSEPADPAVYAANDNGWRRRQGRARVERRRSPPTATSIAYLREGPGAQRRTDAGPGCRRRLGRDLDGRLRRTAFYLDLLARLATDRRRCAGRNSASARLVLIDVATGAQQRHRRQRLLQRLQLLARRQ